MTLSIEAAPAVKFEFKALGALKAAKSADGKLRLHGIASSTTRDLHGDVMTESALEDMERSANGNLTIFLNHDYNVPEDIGGSVEKATRTTRDVDHMGNPNVDLALDIIIDDTNPRAVQAWNSIQGGTKLGLSIGANLPEGGYKRNKDGTYLIEHVELLETSIVGVPANPRSWVEYAVKALNASRETTTVELEATLETLHLADGTEAILIGAACPECGGAKGAKGCGHAYHKGADAAELDVTINDKVIYDGPLTEAALAAAKATAIANGLLVPEVAEATVHIEIDTGNSDESGAGAPTSQEAQASAPGAEAVADAADGESVVIAELTPGYRVPEAQMTDLVNGYAKTVQELMALRLAHVALQTAKAEAEAARDQAVRDRDRVLVETTALLSRLADVPLVRRTAVTTAYGQFRERFGGLYDDGFLKMLENQAHD